ncbi:MAG: hypothetical protein H6823_01655 [Planctomycetaceae bacterium]|nr:hypothetical protein [Planctomycetaceae bacterium]
MKLDRWQSVFILFGLGWRGLPWFIGGIVWMIDQPVAGRQCRFRSGYDGAASSDPDAGAVFVWTFTRSEKT